MSNLDLPTDGEDPWGEKIRTALLTLETMAAKALVPQSYRLNSYYSAPGTRGTLTRPNGFVTLLPIRIEQAQTFVAMATDVSVAGNAGSNLRFGLYADNNGQPGARLYDAGPIACDTTGVKEISGLTMPLAAGWYYLAVAVQNAATAVPTVRTITGQVVPGSPMYTPGGAIVSGVGFQISAAGNGALPATGAAAVPTDTAISLAIKTAAV